MSSKYIHKKAEWHNNTHQFRIVTNSFLSVPPPAVSSILERLIYRQRIESRRGLSREAPVSSASSILLAGGMDAGRATSITIFPKGVAR